MFKCSVLSISVLVIFETQLINSALSLKAIFLSFVLLFGSVTVVVPLATIYALL